MFIKRVYIRIKGPNFKPTLVSKRIGLIFDKCYDVGDKINTKSDNVYTFGSANIQPPNNLIFNEQNDDFDERITWLLNHIENKVDLIKEFGGDEIVLNIVYDYDIENRSQKFIDFINRDQIIKLGLLGISLDITIWPNWGIIPSTIENLGKGFYKTSVEVKDESGNWILKQTKSTFFPDIWSEADILKEIDAIILNGRAILDPKSTATKKKYEGILSNDVKVIFIIYTNFLDNIGIAFPSI